MRPLLAVCFLSTILNATPSAPIDPAAAVTRAKDEIASGHPEIALALLHEATPVAAASTNLRERTSALSAIYFYSAMAELSTGNRPQAVAELQSFLLYSPATSLDPKKFSPDFFAMFKEVQRAFTKRRNAPSSFDDAYPGFPPRVSSSVWPLTAWGASSEFLILATEKEKEDWGRLKDDDARRAFIDSFWIHRDPDPATGVNESRVEYLSRIAFADVAFTETPDGRGSLSDRGRAFVLLGPPKRVSIRPMTRREAPGQPNRSITAGNAMEQWTYFRDQLPKALPNNELLVRFISDGGSLVRRREPDFLVEKALRDAPAALRHD